MTTLRVRLAAPTRADRTDAWALFGAGGHCERTGTGRPDEWPAAERTEAVLAASQLRIVSIKLPPMPASRVAGAAGFALEDQVAGPADAHRLFASTQRTDGGVQVIIVSRALVDEITATGRTFVRIVAEPELAAPSAGWRWCAGGDAKGFVRCADGSAFPVDGPPAGGALPAEIELALGQARREGNAPPNVRVDASVDDAVLSRWQRETGIAFLRGTPWRWETAAAASFASAQNLVTEAPASTSTAPRQRLRQLFAPALLLAGAAVLIQVVASAGEWASLRFDAWRDAREWTSLAVAAGVPPEAASTISSARTAIAARYADLRHAHGMPAPDDALPLLARAAPALAVLPPGTVKSATYADGHWTLDLARVDPARVRDLDTRMRAARVWVLVAASASGTRVRIGGP
ncbi:MAG: type II secretion system protein GspL [Betaproteobacteria bacterium]